MKGTTIGGNMLALAVCISACSQALADTPVQTAAITAVTPAESPAVRAALTLAKGEAALAAQDYATLRKAAISLKGQGAQPEEGAEDVASKWLSIAEQGGASGPPPLYRGRALGPGYRIGYIDRGGIFAMQQTFLAGEKARISVVPREGAQLKVTVTKDDGTKLCDKAVGAPQASCDWMPVFTGRFQISVQNAGSAKAAFYLVVD